MEKKRGSERLHSNIRMFLIEQYMRHMYNLKDTFLSLAKEKKREPIGQMLMQDSNFIRLIVKGQKSLLISL